jgi:hypothetical protein
MDKIGGCTVRGRKFPQSIFESQQVLPWGRLWQLRRIQILAHEMPAVLPSLLAPCVLNQDSAHGLGRSAKEVSAAIPMLSATLIDQANVRLVDEIRGLEHLS